jgi:hypothetical protein
LLAMTARTCVINLASSSGVAAIHIDVAQSVKEEIRVTSVFIVVLLLPNVKEHATLSARARVNHGVEVKTTGDHVNRSADRGCCVSTCSVSY